MNNESLRTTGFRFKYTLLFLITVGLMLGIHSVEKLFIHNNLNLENFSGVLFEKEQQVDVMIDTFFNNAKDRTLAKYVNAQANTIDYLFGDKGLLFLVFNKNQLVYWTSNSIAIPKNDEWYKLPFSNLGNAYAEIRTRSNDTLTVVGLIIVKGNFPYENKFLSNGFHHSFNINCDNEIILNQPDSKYAVVNAGNEYLFTLQNGGICNETSIQTILIVLFLVALVLVLLQGYQIFKFGKVVALHFVLFAIVLVVLRVLMQLYKMPYFVYSTSLFQPEYFWFTNAIPSLGDLLLSVLVVVYLIFIFYAKIELSPLAILSKTKRTMVMIGWVLVYHIYAIGTYVIMSNLIGETAIQYEAYDILNLSGLSFAGYFVIMLLLVGFILLTDKLLLQFKEAIKFLPLLMAILFFTGIALVLVVVFGNITGVLHVLFSGFLAIYWLFIRYNQKPRMGTILLFIAFFSVYLTGFMRTINHANRIEQSKTIAYSLAREQDPVAEVILSNVIKDIKRDTVIKKHLESDWFDYDAMLEYINQTYFTGYLNRYNLQLTVCNIRDSVMLDQSLQAKAHCYDFFSELVAYNCTKTLVDGLYYLKDNSGNLNYFMETLIELSPKWLDVMLFFEFSLRNNVEVLGYPELLLEKPLNESAMGYNLQYAHYNNNRLVSSTGEFPYALERTIYGDFKTEFAFFKADGYDHTLFNASDNHTIIVSFPTVQAYNVLISFTYIFFFLLVIALLMVIIGNRFTHLVHIHINIKNRIVFSMLSVLFISLFFVGGGTIMYAYKQFEKGQIDLLTEKTQSVLVEAEHKLFDVNDINQVSPEYLNNLLVKFSNVFYTDINLYDPQGNLVATSRKEIFERKLTGDKINAIAYRELVLNKKARIVQKENIGKLNYYSAYVPFINAENQLVAYLNLPYFSREVLLRKELMRVVVAVVNIFAFLIILSIAMAIYISNRLTEPLRMLQQRISSINLSKENERISYSGNDEIADLVTEYNRMLEALDQSAQLLAKSERESAWREMARQIAHEIKNPLTPMKLNIQLLGKSWENKDVDFGDRFQNASQTLIEQIESLSSIASAFSQFATMPISRSEKVNVLEKAQRTLEFFSECSFASLKLQTPADSEIYVYADSERLTQVFNNLVKNAIQAIPHNTKGDIVISITSNIEDVVIEIKDNGSGIPVEMQSKLFEPNFTTKTSGTGLGLAIVKNIVDEAGGAIWFDSNPSKGTSFFVRLPRYFNR